MRRYVLTFSRDEGSSAELHLDLDPAFDTVEKWTWVGDPKIKEAIEPLPNEPEQYYGLWLGEAKEAAEREGLKLDGRYDGEPWPTGEDYHPSEDTIQQMRAEGWWK